MEAVDVFAHLRRSGRNDPAQRQHAVMLSALEELIMERKAQEGQRGSKPTPNEYFAAIMTGLEAQDQSHTPELMSLLEKVLPHVDASMLRAKFKPIAGVLTQLLKTNLDNELTSFVRDLILCLGRVLLAQEVSSSAWSSPHMLKTFYLLLSCFREKRPKVRKAATGCTLDLLRAHMARKVTVLAKQVADFSNNVLAACTVNDYVPSLQLLGFLQEALPLLPEDYIKHLSERVLRLQALENNMLVQASLHTIKALMRSETAALSPALAVQLTEAVLDLNPSRHQKDPETTRVFCDLVAACVQRLAVTAPAQANSVLPRAMQALVACCGGEDPSVYDAACLAMRLSLASCCPSAASEPSCTPDQLRPLVDAISATEKLLELRYKSSWSVTLPFLGSLFVHFKDQDAALVTPLLKKLGDLHDAVLSMSPHTAKAIEGPISMAIEGLGMETVLQVLSIEDQAGLAGRRLWLLPALASHGKRQPSRLAFFQKYILALAQKSNTIATAQQTSEKLKHAHTQRVVQLWSLLPAFCAQPSDITESLGAIAPILVNALQDSRYPDIFFVICQSLQALVKSTQESGNEKDLKTMAELSKKFLPTLFTLLYGLPADDATSGPRIKALSDTISAYAAVAPKAFVGSLFKKLVHKLLEATKSVDGKALVGDSSTAVVLCELALALVPSLDRTAVGLLYSVIRPLVQLDGDHALQKRAYRVLAAMCEHQAEVFLTPERLNDLLPLLTDSLLTCHISARQMRLRVLGQVVQTFDPTSDEHMMTLANLLGEVLLCLKDSNAKAREAAYELLLLMARVKSDDNMAQFTQMVVAALAAQTPHMRSAAVLALARLVFEFASEVEGFRDMIPDLLTTVMLLGRDPNKEVVKSVVSFVRVCVPACPQDRLEALLPGILECLFASNSRVNFRVKIRIILKKLCRKFGYDRVLQLAPETDRKLIHHLHKMARRGDRITAEQKGAQAGPPKRSFEAVLGDDDHSDDDDDDDGMDDHDSGDGDDPRTAKSMTSDGRNKGKRRRWEGSVQMKETGGDVVDMLDMSMMRNLKLVGSRRKREEDNDDDGDVKFNAEGKLLVEDGDEDDDGQSSRKPSRAAPDFMDLGEDALSSDDDDVKKVEGNRAKKRRTLDGAMSSGHKSKAAQQAPGASFRSKKAGGDVRKKGQLEPYAYIPLRAKLLSKKHRKEAVETFGSVVGSRKARKELKGRRARRGGRR